MLVQVLNYVKKQGIVSTQQMARFFRMDEDALQPMINIWVDKGAIRPCEITSACKTTCFKCNKSTPLYYEPNVIDS